ncbi:MAG: hypothetical protein FWD75_09820 [Propionibacteriaceae bacterium]|nr:hypothetical protein [Propionibacteriaceae bacterium]
MTDLGELVPVWVSTAGEPTRFEWRDRRYAVSGRPVPWINREPWWTSASLVGSVQALTQHMWRVTGVDPATGESIHADLAVEDGSWWRLTHIDD